MRDAFLRLPGDFTLEGKMGVPSLWDICTDNLREPQKEVVL